MADVQSLIKEYGLITGRPPGWETHLTIAEYLEFKKVATESTQVVPVQPVQMSQISQPAVQIPVTPAAATQPAKQEPVTLVVSSPVKKEAVKPVVKEITETMSELDLFKSLKD